MKLNICEFKKNVIRLVCMFFYKCSYFNEKTVILRLLTISPKIKKQKSKNQK